MKDSKAEILDFWFVETAPVQWFQKNDVFDDMIRDRFLSVYDMAKSGFYEDWVKDPYGSLALCLVYDQFPRNMFRHTAKAFETDSLALQIAKDAIANGFDQVLPLMKRRFMYLPFEHSENLEDQKKGVALFEAIIDEDPLGYEYALRHLRIIETYGRFPHRNAALGRENTKAEQDYLAQLQAGF